MLPTVSTSFVGREDELSELSERVSERRLVAVTGPAGVGKSRLAAEFARRTEHTPFVDAWWCDVAGVCASADLLHAIARSVALQDDAVGPNVIVRALDARGPTLLVLDDCDELDDDAARCVSEMAAAATDLRLLVTTRNAGRLRDSECFALEPLSTSDEAAPAVRLFLARKRDSGTGVPLADVLTIVRRLDGLPLAIELVASLPHAEGTEALLAATSSLLEAPPPLQSQAKRSLHEALSISWSQLDEVGRDTLCALSIFAGGFDLAAANAVVGASAAEQATMLLRLRALRDQSLLRTQSTNHEMRYALFDSVRRFAAAKLRDRGNEEVVLERHGAYFAALALRAVDEGYGPGRSQWIVRLSPDEENLRAVATDDGCTAEARLAATTGLVWLAMGRGPLGTVAPLCKQVASRCLSEVADIRQRALFELWASMLFRGIGDLDAGIEFAHLAILHAEAIGDERLLAWALVQRARQYQFRGDDDDAARAMLDRAFALATKVDDSGVMVLVHSARLADAGMVDERGDAPGAAFYARLQELAARSKDAVMIARAWSQSALWLAAHDRNEEAFEALGRVRNAGEELRHGSWVTLSRVLRGLILHAAGDLSDARAELSEALLSSVRTGFRYSEGECQVYLAQLDLEEGDVDAAVLRLVDGEKLVAPSASERTLAVALRALAEAKLGHATNARAKLGHAQRRCPRPNALMFAPVALLAAATESVLSGSIPANAARLLEGSRGPRSLTAKVAKRLLRSALAPLLLGADALIVGRGGGWLRLPGQGKRILADSPVLRSLLWHLVEMQLDRPGEPVPRQTLVAAIWKNEELAPRVALRRLGAALHGLETTGIERWLHIDDRGAWLDPAASIFVSDDAS